ncbi:MAG: hypothetical protein ACLQIK_14470 [Mycobacterium sp.]|uniref:hypothetical protein n=1 Tax=Mycobacterium sp. TaxID=1785 RepID=UPI003F94E9D1
MFEHPGPLDDCIVTLEYTQAAVHTIRDLPSWASTFDAGSKTWRIHPAWADRLAASLRRIGYEIIGVDLDRTA